MFDNEKVEGAEATRTGDLPLEDFLRFLHAVYQHSKSRVVVNGKMVMSVWVPLGGFRRQLREAVRGRSPFRGAVSAERLQELRSGLEQNADYGQAVGGAGRGRHGSNRK